MDKAFKKYLRKDPLQKEAVLKKIEQILNNPRQYKPLKWPQAGERRVHIGSFVLTFEIIEEEKVVRLLDYDHHDKIYKK